MPTDSNMNIYRRHTFFVHVWQSGSFLWCVLFAPAQPRLGCTFLAPLLPCSRAPLLSCPRAPPALAPHRSRAAPPIWAEFPVEFPCLRDRNSLFDFSPPPMIIPAEERFLWSTTGGKKRALSTSKPRPARPGVPRLHVGANRVLNRISFPSNQHKLRVSTGDRLRTFQVPPPHDKVSHGKKPRSDYLGVGTSSICEAIPVQKINQNPFVSNVGGSS